MAGGVLLTAPTLEDVDDSASVVVAFQGPGVGVLGCFEERYSACAFLTDVVVDVLAVHVLLGEVAALVLEYLAVHRQDLREQANLRLLLQLVAGVSVDENALPGRVGVQVEEPEELGLAVEVQDDFLDCVDGGVRLGTGVDVAAVEVDAVGVDPVVPAGDPIGVEDGEEVEDEAIPEQSRLLAVLSEFADDAGHHVRAWHFSRVHPRPYYKGLLIREELLGFAPIREEVPVLEWLVLAGKASLG
jgi:hypothetical protein